MITQKRTLIASASFVLAAALLTPVAYSQSSAWQEVDKLVPWEPQTGDRFGSSATFDGEQLIVGAYTDLTDAGPGSGSVSFFGLSANGTWEEVGHLIASDALPSNWLGGSVAIDGNVAVAGAIGDDRPGGLESGSAYVFLRDAQGQWAEAAKLTASDAAAADYFGSSVGVSGDYVFVGAYGVDGLALQSGAVYVFRRTGTEQWDEVQILASNSPTTANFGNSLACDTDTLVVGAVASAEAFVFELNDDDEWVEVAQLSANPTAPFFGKSVAIDGDTIVVGAQNDVVLGYNAAGAAYIYRRDGNGLWQFMERIVASEPAPRSWFGRSVAIRDGVIAVGSVKASYYGLSESGAAYVYRESPGGQWVWEARLLASDALPADWLGQSVAVGDGVIFVGAELALDPVSSYRCGGVYVYLARAIGDLNCDGFVNNADIPVLVLALTDPAGYSAAYPDCDLMLGDVDGDGEFNNADIPAFVALLTGE